MKNYRVFLFALIVIMSCNSEREDQPKQVGPVTVADSLEIYIDKKHIIGMGRMGKLTRYQQYTSRLIDSIEALPLSSKQSLSGYKLRLDSLLSNLNYAETAMDKWMGEYKPDSMSGKPAARDEYFESEKIKVEHMVAAILKGIAKADSILPIGNKAKR